MADTEYPLVGYKYQVKVDGEEHRCSEVSGLNVEYEVINWEDGMTYINGGNKGYMHGKPSLVEFSMKKAFMQSDSRFYQWLTEARNDKRDVTVSLLDDEGNTQVTWNIKGAMPKKIDAPNFDASSGEIAVDSIDLTAARVSVVYS